MVRVRCYDIVKGPLDLSTKLWHILCGFGFWRCSLHLKQISEKLISHLIPLVSLTHIRRICSHTVSHTNYHTNSHTVSHTVSYTVSHTQFLTQFFTQFRIPPGVFLMHPPGGFSRTPPQARLG